LSSNNGSFSRSATRLTHLCSFAVILSKIGRRIESVQFARFLVADREATAAQQKAAFAEHRLGATVDQFAKER
jgi:hypothetical protein